MKKSCGTWPVKYEAKQDSASFNSLVWPRGGNCIMESRFLWTILQIFISYLPNYYYNSFIKVTKMTFSLI